MRIPESSEVASAVSAAGRRAVQAAVRAAVRRMYPRGGFRVARAATCRACGKWIAPMATRRRVRIWLNGPRDVLVCESCGEGDRVSAAGRGVGRLASSRAHTEAPGRARNPGAA